MLFQREVIFFLEFPLVVDHAYNYDTCNLYNE